MIRHSHIPHSMAGFDGLMRPSDCSEYRQLEKRATEFMESAIGEFNPDCIVLVRRKGERIFRDIYHHHSIIGPGVDVVCDSDIHDLQHVPERVLVVDDSVKTGRNAGVAIDLIRAKAPDARVMVAAFTSNRVVKSVFENERGVEFRSMELFDDEESQCEDNLLVFMLTGMSGIRPGTGYIGFEFMTDCHDHEPILAVMDGIVSDLFGCYDKDIEKTPCKDAVKVTYRLSSLEDDGVCTSDQKVFAYLDLSDVGMRVEVELLINPPSGSIRDLESPKDVLAFTERMLSPKIDAMMEKVGRDLGSRGFGVWNIRTRRPSEYMLL